MGIWGRDDWRLEKSTNTDNINIVISAFRSIFHPVAYVSMPITSGKIAYEVLEKKGVKSLEELAKVDKDIIFTEIISPNIRRGIECAERVSGKIILPVLAPSVFEAKKQRWDQNDYMFLWFRVLEERAERVYMMNDWQYSNGGSEEFVRAMEMQYGFITPNCGMEHFPKGTDLQKEYERLRKVKVFSEEGKEITFNDGFNLISAAILDLKRRDFRSQVLNDSVTKLASICSFFGDPLVERQDWTSRRRYDQDLNYMQVLRQFEELKNVLDLGSTRGTFEPLPYNGPAYFCDFNNL